MEQRPNEQLIRECHACIARGDLVGMIAMWDESIKSESRIDSIMCILKWNRGPSPFFATRFGAFDCLSCIKPTLTGVAPRTAEAKV